MADLIIPAGDKGFNLAFTVQDADGNAFDLTGYTVSMKWWSGANTSGASSGSCDITVAASGTCTRTVADGDFDMSGVYNFELKLAKTGVVESTKSYTLEVKRSA